MSGFKSVMALVSEAAGSFLSVQLTKWLLHIIMLEIASLSRIREDAVHVCNNTAHKMAALLVLQRLVPAVIVMRLCPLKMAADSTLCIAYYAAHTNIHSYDPCI